jgi:DNA-binding LacI/PurR family transcriptional regulator
LRRTTPRTALLRSRSRAGTGAATIRDVAEAAGVSVTTVSHVMNGTRHVAPATSERVLGAVTHLGYRPSAVARALKGERTATLGMLVTSSTNPFFAEVIRGVEEACFERGYSLILGNTGDVGQRLEAYLATLYSKRIDGLVVMTTNMDHDFLRRLGEDRAVPVVAIDTLDVPGITTVNDDSATGGRIAAEYLLEQGFRRIAAVTGPADHPRSRQRFEGFTAALGAHGLSIDPALVVATDLTVAGGYNGMQRLLGKAGEPPEAIFCLNDLIAFGGLCALDRALIAVPRQVSVIGYDDIEYAAYMVPPLTTIRQPANDIGRGAAEILIEQVMNGAAVQRAIEFTPQLVERQSVKRRVHAIAANAESAA